MKPLAAGERVLQCEGEITSWRNAVRRHQREGVSLRILEMKIPNRSITDTAFQRRSSVAPFAGTFGFS